MTELLSNPSALLAATDASTGMLVTIVTAISAGTILVIIARRLGVPMIVLLLAGGALLGPGVWGEYAPVQPDLLGEGLQVLVSLAVGLILFEGGLTLDVGGYRSASRMIKRLLTVGVLVTWLGSAVAIWGIMGIPRMQAIVAASLIIVTGPTVIAPLLKRIKVTHRLSNILHWEGVLIDPIGVFIAVLCFEWISETGGGQEALANLGIRIAGGLLIGVAGGFVIQFCIKRKLVPDELLNIFVLSMAILVFGLAEIVRREAGLLSVTAAGFIIGLTRTVSVKQIRAFKEELTNLLIGTLFILLAARLSFEQFRDFGVEGLVVVAVVMFVIRPLSILLCSAGLDLSSREKLFLGWVAPRGIVAASMASLIALSLEGMDQVENPKFVETFTYSVIIATIVLQGLTAGPFARLLGLQQPKPTGWLIVGAHAFARRIAEFIQEHAKVHVLMVDTNARGVREAANRGLLAVTADARDTELQQRPEFQGVGNLLALTDNEDLNVRLCQHWSEVLGAEHVYRCNPTGTQPGAREEEEALPGRLVWPGLPKPSLIAAELHRGEAVTRTEEGYDPAYARVATPIVSVSNRGMLFAPPTSDEKTTKPAEISQVLYLQREADYLVRSVRPELVMRLDVPDLPTLFHEMVARIVDVNPAMPHEELVDELLDRERSFPSVIGHGIALPHTYHAALEGRLCAVAQVPEGIIFDEKSSEPVRLVFLLLSPQGDPEGHLATLAEVARLVIDERVRKQLMEAEKPLDVLNVIRHGHQLR